jgi:hypothetical protein
VFFNFFFWAREEKADCISLLSASFIQISVHWYVCIQYEERSEVIVLYLCLVNHLWLSKKENLKNFDAFDPYHFIPSLYLHLWTLPKIGIWVTTLSTPSPKITGWYQDLYKQVHKYLSSKLYYLHLTSTKLQHHLWNLKFQYPILVAISKLSTCSLLHWTDFVILWWPFIT